MSRAQISKHYTRILSSWPVDRLRPEVSLQNVLKKRIEAAPVSKPVEQGTAQVQSAQPKRSSEMEEINALYSLLENRYTQSFRVSQSMMRPTSSPDHYTNLAKELEELPDRSWFSNFMRRITGMVRMK